MTSERGAANIRKYNAQLEEKNFALVEQELLHCRKRKLQFKTIGMLSAYISDRAHIHRTTLLRNVKYKAMLAVYMSSQPGGATIVSDDSNDPQILKAKLASSQVEVGTLRKEIKRLTAQLSRATATQTISVGSESEIEFANLCVLLSLVLVRSDTFAIDRQGRTLVDLAARPSERVVANTDRTSAFIGWLERNSSLPFVKAVRLT